MIQNKVLGNFGTYQHLSGNIILFLFIMLEALYSKNVETIKFKCLILTLSK